MTFRMIALALVVALAGPALAMMKRIMERSDLSQQDREFRLQTIKLGRSPLLSTNF